MLKIADFSRLGRRRKESSILGQTQKAIYCELHCPPRNLKKWWRNANCKVGICIFPELHAELTDFSTLGWRRKGKSSVLGQTNTAKIYGELIAQGLV